MGQPRASKAVILLSATKWIATGTGEVRNASLDDHALLLPATASDTDTARSIPRASASFGSPSWFNTHTAAIQLAPLLAASLTSCSSVLPVMAHQWMIRTPVGEVSSPTLAGKLQASPVVHLGTWVTALTW